MTITREFLVENYYYDPDSGVFINLAKGSRPITGTQVSINYRNYYVHRLAWLWVYGEWPSGQIDHINRNPTDNRINNLRVVSDAENKQNSGLSCRGWTKHGRKYRVKVATKGGEHFIASFDSPEEAHAAYVTAKVKLHPFFVKVQ